MKRWIVRIVAFVLIAMGALLLHRILDDHVFRPGRFLKEMQAHHSQELKVIGTMLSDWIAEGRADKAETFVRSMSTAGRHITLLDGELRILAGEEPDAEALLQAERALKGKELESNMLRAFPDTRQGIAEALPFSGLDGSSYVLAVTALPPPRPGEDEPLYHLLGAVGMAVVVAFLLVLVLIPRLNRPMAELRKAFRRLSHGDLDVRLENKLEGHGSEFSRLASEFNTTVESLARKQEEQRMLLCGISHDMRSPLTRMTLAMDMALAEKSTDSLRLLKRMRRDTEHLNALVGQMVGLAETSCNGKDCELVDVTALAGELAEACRFEAADSGKNVVLLAAAPCHVKGDREQLSRMLGNIIRNGMDHTSPGTSVTLSVGHVQYNGREFALIRVEDRGPGVAQSELGNIFKPFYRIPGSSSAGKKAGDDAHMGLGLAIAQYVAVSHSGRIYAENLAQGGLAVCIHLPLQDPATLEDRMPDVSKESIHGKPRQDIPPSPTVSISRRANHC